MMQTDAFIPMSRVRIELDPPELFQDTPEIDACWDHMRQDRPRLFDGPILSFLDQEAGVIRATRESYKRLAVQIQDRTLINPPVMQLSVTGVLVARDNDNKPHVLMGKRSNDTRIYGSLWELGPSGGIDPPTADVQTLDEIAVIRQLQIECRDEIGISGAFTSHDVLGIIGDHLAMSTDIVIRLDLQRHIDDLKASSNNWEYTRIQWVPADELIEFGTREQTIPPTAALLPIVADMLAG